MKRFPLAVGKAGDRLVAADAFESPRGKWAITAAGSIVAVQVIFCVLSLPGLL